MLNQLCITVIKPTKPWYSVFLCVAFANILLRIFESLQRNISFVFSFNYFPTVRNRVMWVL